MRDCWQDTTHGLLCILDRNIPAEPPTMRCRKVGGSCEQEEPGITHSIDIAQGHLLARLLHRAPGRLEMWRADAKESRASGNARPGGDLREATQRAAAHLLIFRRRLSSSRGWLYKQ